MDTRTRWIVGILIVLVMGLGFALIFGAADDWSDSGTTVTLQSTTKSTRSTTIPETTTSGTTTSSPPTGGTGVPGGTTAPGGGSGGL